MRFVRRLGDAPGELDPEALAECLSEYPLSLAVLYGSWSRGAATALSDLDVAVAFEEGVSTDRRAGLLDEMMAEILRETGFAAVDLVDLEEAPPSLGYEALSSGRLLVGDESEATALESELLLKKLDFQPVTEQWQAALAERIEEGEYGRTPIRS